MRLNTRRGIGFDIRDSISTTEENLAMPPRPRPLIARPLTDLSRILMDSAFCQLLCWIFDFCVASLSSKFNDASHALVFHGFSFSAFPFPFELLLPWSCTFLWRAEYYCSWPKKLRGILIHPGNPRKSHRPHPWPWKRRLHTACTVLAILVWTKHFLYVKWFIQVLRL